MSILKLSVADSLCLMDDSVLDRLYVSLGFKSIPNRDQKIDHILDHVDQKSLDRKIRYWLKAYNQMILPVDYLEPKSPVTHSLDALSYLNHHSYKPLALYLHAWKLSIQEIHGLLTKYFFTAPTKIPSHAELECLIRNACYLLTEQEESDQTKRVVASCLSKKLSGFDVFYDPLYFDTYAESQCGWGVTLSTHDTALYGFAMLSGDTVEDICSTIESLRKKPMQERKKLHK